SRPRAVRSSSDVGFSRWSLIANIGLIALLQSATLCGAAKPELRLSPSSGFFVNLVYTFRGTLFLIVQERAIRLKAGDNPEAQGKPKAPRQALDSSRALSIRLSSVHCGSVVNISRFHACAWALGGQGCPRS